MPAASSPEGDEISSLTCSSDNIEDGDCDPQLRRALRAIGKDLSPLQSISISPPDPKDLPQGTVVEFREEWGVHIVTLSADARAPLERFPGFKIGPPARPKKVQCDLSQERSQLNGGLEQGDDSSTSKTPACGEAQVVGKSRRPRKKKAR